jgi:hypothetical protein
MIGSSPQGDDRRSPKKGDFNPLRTLDTVSFVQEIRLNPAVISQSIATLAGDFWGDIALFSPRIGTNVL